MSTATSLGLGLHMPEDVHYGRAAIKRDAAPPRTLHT
jgi:hypothetical protein